MALILVCGMPRSGKTSIINVIFEGQSPVETKNLDPTFEFTVSNVNLGSSVALSAIEIPSIAISKSHSDNQVATFMDLLFHRAACLVCVLDGGNDRGSEVGLRQEIKFLTEHIQSAFSVNTELKIYIFINKVDDKLSCQDSGGQDLIQFVSNILSEELANKEIIDSLEIFNTSIYNHSIYAAMSQIMNQVLTINTLLNPLLNVLGEKCYADKVALVDNITGLMLCSDSSPYDDLWHELVNDSIDVIREVADIYLLLVSGNGTRRCSVDISERYKIYARHIEGSIYVTFLLNRTIQEAAANVIIDKNIDIFSKLLREGIRYTHSWSVRENGTKTKTV